MLCAFNPGLRNQHILLPQNHATRSLGCEEVDAKGRYFRPRSDARSSSFGDALVPRDRGLREER